MIKILTLTFAILASQAWAQQPITIDAATVTYQLNENKITFTGPVNVEQGQRTLKSQALVANLTEGGELRTLNATGGVTLTQRGTANNSQISETATSTRATFNLAQNTLTLSGNATITRGENTLNGETLVYNLTDGTVKVTPKAGERIRANLQPSE